MPQSDQERVLLDEAFTQYISCGEFRWWPAGTPQTIVARRIHASPPRSVTVKGRANPGQ